MIKKNYKELPEIRIQYGWFLDRLFKEISEKNKGKYPGFKNIQNKINSFQKAWRPVEKKVLRGLIKILDLNFRQNTIDVFIVGKCRSFSNPMVISSHYAKDDFVDVLTHEILHRLLTDNMNDRLNVSEIWDMMFPGERMTVRNHVLVHAVHKHIYLDILKSPKRLKNDIKTSSKFPDYKRSWDIVEERGYLVIIADFKSRFKV